MTLTQREQARSWRATERLRGAYRTRVTKYMRLAFKEQIEPLNSFFESTGNSLQPNEYINKVEYLIKEDPFIKSFERTYVQVGTAFADQTYRDLKSGHPQDLNIKTDLDDLNSNWRVSMLAFVQGREMGSRITSITGTSQINARRIMRRSMEQSVQEGLGISETSIRMRADLKEGWGDMSKYRADRIARTELVSASNKGSLMGAESSDIEQVKLWISALDGRIRSAHAKANNETVDLKDPFIKTGQDLNYPGDPNGSAWNVINCRCSLGYRPKDQEEDEEIPPEPTPKPVARIPKPPKPKPPKPVEAQGGRVQVDADLKMKQVEAKMKDLGPLGKKIDSLDGKIKKLKVQYDENWDELVKNRGLDPKAGLLRSDAIRAELKAARKEILKLRHQASDDLLEVMSLGDAVTMELTGSAAMTNHKAVKDGMKLFNGMVGDNAAIRGKALQVKAARGRAFQSRQTINVMKKDPFETTAHEAGHWLEQEDKIYSSKVHDFLRRRAGTDKSKKLRDLTGLNYDSREIAWEDKFSEPYMGKIYGYQNIGGGMGSASGWGGTRIVASRTGITAGEIETFRATELTSMWFTEMGRDPLGFYKTDRDYFETIYRALIEARNKGG